MTICFRSRIRLMVGYFTSLNITSKNCKSIKYCKMLKAIPCTGWSDPPKGRQPPTLRKNSQQNVERETASETKGIKVTVAKNMTLRLILLLCHDSFHVIDNMLAHFSSWHSMILWGPSKFFKMRVVQLSSQGWLKVVVEGKVAVTPCIKGNIWAQCLLLGNTSGHLWTISWNRFKILP